MAIGREHSFVARQRSVKFRSKELAHRNEFLCSSCAPDVVVRAKRLRPIFRRCGLARLSRSGSGFPDRKQHKRSKNVDKK